MGNAFSELSRQMYGVTFEHRPIPVIFEHASADRFPQSKSWPRF